MEANVREDVLAMDLEKWTLLTFEDEDPIHRGVPVELSSHPLSNLF